MDYRIDHIPKSTPFNRRPGFAMVPTTITIHNTGNSSSSAKNERAWLTNPANGRTACYQIVVDEHGAIECLPLNEVAWHAGDGSGDGNRKSIGIEICESGDYQKTLDNAAQLIAGMLRERGWGVDRLRRHYDWSKKICPRLMYSGGTWTGWTAFKDKIAAILATKENQCDVPAPELEQEKKEEDEELMKLEQWQWKMFGDALDGLYRAGKISDYTWAEKAYKGELTQSEIAWLNMIMFAREQGVEV